MSRKMHIVLAFILSVFSIVLVVMNFNQYSELERIESKGSVTLHVEYPQYKRTEVSVQISSNPIFKDLKPYKSTNRNVTRTVQQPGFLSGNFSAESILHQTSGVNSGQPNNNQVQSLNSMKSNPGMTNSFVGQYSAGNSNINSNNRGTVNHFSGFSSVQLNHRNQTKLESQLYARGQNNFNGSLFGQAVSEPSFAKSSLTFEPLGIDPGGDPEDPGQMIPVPDGLFFLIFISLLYGLYLLFGKKSY